MIEFKNVEKIYQQNNAPITGLTDFSLQIKKNEIVGIVGQSGSGKSTLLRLINQLEQQSSGTIIVNGRDVGHLKKTELVKMRQEIGMIFQQFNLLNNLTVSQNVALPLKLKGEVNQEIVANMLKFVKLSDKATAYPQQLSGGEKQRVAIVRALSFQPLILLCDEPTSALDEEHSEEIIALLKQIQQEFQTTIVIVSHELQVIKALATRAVLLEGGRLIDVIPVEPSPIVNTNWSYPERARERLSQ